MAETPHFPSVTGKLGLSFAMIPHLTFLKLLKIQSCCVLMCLSQVIPNHYPWSLTSYLYGLAFSCWLPWYESTSRKDALWAYCLCLETCRKENSKTDLLKFLKFPQLMSTRNDGWFLNWSCSLQFKHVIYNMFQVCNQTFLLLLKGSFFIILQSIF